MTNELVLAEVVRAWTAKVLPGEPNVAERAATLARACYAGGASVTEACWTARRFVDSFVRHPAHCIIDARVAVPVAS